MAILRSNLKASKTRVRSGPATVGKAHQPPPRRIEAPTPEQKATFVEPSPAELSEARAAGGAVAAVATAACKRSRSAWFETFGRIRDKDGKVVKPVQNILQWRFDQVTAYCRKHDLPCRVIVLKPRQKGSSTMSVSDLYHEVRRASDAGKMVEGRIMGGQFSQVANLWGIYQTYHSLDQCEWGKSQKANKTEAVTETGSVVKWETANNPDAGRSATITHAVITELARWAEEGVAGAAKVLSGFMNCVPNRGGTTIILESTAQGAEGAFHDRWQQAITFDELVAGKRGFVKIFAAWYEFEDSYPQYPVTEEMLIELRTSLDYEEVSLQKLYDVKDEQLLWRRDVIRDEFAGDGELFKQEFPSNPEEAFLLSGRPKFSKPGLAQQETLAKNAERTIGQYGNLDEAPRPIGEQPGQPGSLRPTEVSWRPTAPSLDDEPAMFRRWEEPKEGYRYNLSVDTMTGAAQAMGLDPDCHGGFVLRAGTWEVRAGEHYWLPPATAMRLVSEPRNGYGCRLEIHELAKQVRRMAAYYGNCHTVIEMNKGTDLIELLRQFPEMRLYQREVFNQREQKATKAIGWKTDEATRPMLIDRLAGAITQTGTTGEGIEIRCEHAVAQCKHFVMDVRGRAQAASGWHDDDVISLGMNLVTINLATTYYLPAVERALPSDVASVQARMQGGQQVASAEHS